MLHGGHSLKWAWCPSVSVATSKKKRTKVTDNHKDPLITSAPTSNSGHRFSFRKRDNSDTLREHMAGQIPAQSGTKKKGKTVNDLLGIKLSVAIDIIFVYTTGSSMAVPPVQI